MDGTAVFDWRNKGQDVALAIARGLHFLHQQNVVHRCKSADHAEVLLGSNSMPTLTGCMPAYSPSPQVAIR